MSSSEVPDKNGRYANRYRMTDEFIKKTTNRLIILLFAGLTLGLVLGIAGSSIFDNEMPLWYLIITIAVAASGLIIPLYVSAWLGGQAIRRGGGFVGLLLITGGGLLATGYSIENAMLFWVGIGVTALATLLFIYIGVQAKVPMWLQLPILNSPRLYVRNKPASKNEPKK